MLDWLTFHSAGYSTQRQELQWRLAQVIRRVALTDEDILSLPNNYEAALNSNTFPAYYQSGKPEIGFLPADLFKPDGEWVCVGREGGPIAMSHTEEFPFYGRSAFLVFIRIPGRREATLKFLQELNSEHSPSLLSYGSEVALVRRAMVINEQGEITPSPIVESVQIRHFNSDIAQSFYEFELNRGFLFAGTSGGLQPVANESTLFHSDVDVFQAGSSIGEGVLPNVCFPCHGAGGFTANILSYSRRDFPLPEGSEFLSKEQRPILIETTPELEAQTVITWKQKHETWQALETLWHQGTP